MLNDDILGVKAAFGKCLIQDIEWENMKCRKCDIRLVDDQSTVEADFKVCPVCGEKYARIKKIHS